MIGIEEGNLHTKRFILTQIEGGGFIERYGEDPLQFGKLVKHESLGILRTIYISIVPQWR
jgi:hypothetical protein